MRGFYSSLVINSKKFPNIHPFFRPRFNREYFKRLTQNLTALEASIAQRCRYQDPDLSSDKLKDLRDNAARLNALRERLEKVGFKDPNFEETLHETETLEDRLMPTVLSIPNRTSKLVPDQETIVDEIKSDFQARENLVKVLSHRKLSYINNCYSKSVVGPNSHYYFNIGAKLQHALSSYFSHHLESENFIPVSGLCLTRSAVVEAANSKDGKEYFDDPARILGGNSKYITSHLTESSRESLLSFVTTLGHIASNAPLRLVTSGSSYRLGSDWFDGDDKRITQTETVHALVLNSSIESYSMAEYHRVRDLVWNSYKRLDLPVRLVHCSNESMFMNEFDAHRVDVWVPSRKEWIQVSRVSHYRDYLTIRAGMKRGHVVDSMVYDGQVLVAAIIENRQTSLGKFIIPNALDEHLTHLTKDERDSYLRSEAMMDARQLGGSSSNRAQVLMNHEQRRYLVKKNYIFAHGRKARKVFEDRSAFKLAIGSSCVIFILLAHVDWDAIWCDYLDDRKREFLYDKIWLRMRRAFFYINSSPQLPVPDEPKYADLDHSRYLKSNLRRKRDAIKILRNRDDPTVGEELGPDEDEMIMGPIAKVAEKRGFGV